MSVRNGVEVVSTSGQFSSDFLSLEAMAQVRQDAEQALARVASCRILIRLDWDDWHVVYVDGVAFCDVCRLSAVYERVTLIRACEVNPQVHLATNVEEWFQVLLTTLDPLEQLAHAGVINRSMK